MNFAALDLLGLNFGTSAATNVLTGVVLGAAVAALLTSATIVRTFAATVRARMVRQNVRDVRSIRGGLHTMYVTRTAIGTKIATPPPPA